MLLSCKVHLHYFKITLDPGKVVIDDMDKQVGKVTHYYDKIGVAVVEVASPIKVGDNLKFSGHDKEFTQEVTSMQIEHQQIEKAKKGQSIGMKVDQPVKPNDRVYLVS